MNPRIYTQNKLTATFFLVVLGIFYLVSILCSTGLKDVLFKNNSHSHQHSHSSGHNHEEHETPSSKNESKGGCCKEVSVVFFASLKSSKVFKFSIKKVNLIEAIPVYYSSLYNPYDKFLYLNPLQIWFFKPKILDIRIFIQSFII